MECVSASTNDEIADAIEERKPEVVAVNAGQEEGSAEFTENEQELKEEGYTFTPSSHQKLRNRRRQALESELFSRMGSSSPHLIRFAPHITAEELAIHGDEGLESYGIDTSGITSAEKFDAVLGAVTARFYQQNQARDMGIIVPDNMEDD